MYDSNKDIHIQVLKSSVYIMKHASQDNIFDLYSVLSQVSNVQAPSVMTQRLELTQIRRYFCSCLSMPIVDYKVLDYNIFVKFPVPMSHL